MESSESHEGQVEESAEEESAPVDPSSEESSEATEGSPSESGEEVQPEQSPSSDQTIESSEPSSEPSSAGEESGPLAGTSSELEPGVGAGGEHPAPAAMRDESGELHSAGRPPAGNVESEEAPVGDETDQHSGSSVTDPEALEAEGRVSEPEQVETDRPDIGTPE